MVSNHISYNVRISKASNSGIVILFLLTVILVSLISDCELIFPFVLIPIIYVVGHILLNQMYRYAFSPGLFVINLLYFFRFYVMPLAIMMGTQTNYTILYLRGTWFLIFEEIVGVFTFFFYFKHNRKRDVSDCRSSDTYRFNYRLFKKILLFLIVCSILIIIYNPSVLLGYSFIVGLSGESMDLGSEASREVSTINGLIVGLTILLLPVLPAIYFTNKYKNTGNNLWYYFALFFSVFISISFINGGDRGTLLLQGIATLFLMLFLCPEKMRTTIKLSLFGVSVLSMYLIVLRLSFFEVGFSLQQIIDVLVDYLSGYIASIKSMTIALKTADFYKSGIGLDTVFNDLFANTPFLSHYTTFSNTSSYYYNVVWGRPYNVVDQVMPLMGNGLLYFDYIVAPVFNILMILFVLFIDELYKDASDVFGAYVWSYAASIMAFCHYQNLQLIMLYFSCRILPLFMVYFITKHFKFGKGILEK